MFPPVHLVSAAKTTPSYMSKVKNENNMTYLENNSANGSSCLHELVLGHFSWFGVLESMVSKTVVVVEASDWEGFHVVKFH
jgi:hypothetical protein